MFQRILSAVHKAAPYIWTSVTLVLLLNLIVKWSFVATWLQHTFGFAAGDGNTPQYLFWSGSGSDLAYFSAAWGGITSTYILYRKHNCHEPWCPRIGHDVIDNKGTLSCWHHHPEGKPRPGHVARKHTEHQARLKLDNQDPQAT